MYPDAWLKRQASPSAPPLPDARGDLRLRVEGTHGIQTNGDLLRLATAVGELLLVLGALRRSI